MKFLRSLPFRKKPCCVDKMYQQPSKSFLEIKSLKLIPSVLIKLSFFCVVAFDFCCSTPSPGLALNKAHGKRWHVGMARVLHDRIGQWRHEFLPALGPL